MAKNNSVALTALILGGVAVPLSGDGVVSEIQPDAPASVQEGVAQKIISHMNNPGGVLTITCYPEDDAFKVLWDLYNTWRAAQGVGLPLAGTASTVQYNCAWQAAAFTALPALRREQESSTTTFELTLDGLNTVAL